MRELRREALALLRPPPPVDLAEWAEESISLPAAIAAVPGRIRLSPQQRGIARSMGDCRASTSMSATDKQVGR